MARPGKAIFDTTMMAGWAFAAVLTGLVALTMVDDDGDSADGRGVVAALDPADRTIVTGSVPKTRRNDTSTPTAAIHSGATDDATDIIDRQNRTYNPFGEQNRRQMKQMQTMLTQLKALQREVNAFHASTKKLREENSHLKTRIANLEEDGGLRRDRVRVVELPKRDDARSPLTLRRVDRRAIDTQATGSIPTQSPISQGKQTFDPFAVSRKSSLKLKEQPLTMDVDVLDNKDKGAVSLPRAKPSGGEAVSSNGQAIGSNGGDLMRPISEVIKAPGDISTPSQTSFALDLGQFRNLAELTSAWNEISISQRGLVGDLKPLSNVSYQNGQAAVSLLVGPFQNAAQATTLCANLQHNGYSCSVSIFQGQALALRN